MVGLLDIAPLSEKVRGVDVTGISAKGVAYLLQKFPEIKTAMLGMGSVVKPADWAAMAPDALAAIIAAGTGKPGDSETEDRAASLPLEIQLEFIESILKATMPSGVGPFVERLQKLGEFVEGFGKVAATNSPQTSKA